MLKRFNLLALTVLLIFQTVIAPIAATAQINEISENLNSANTANVTAEHEEVENQSSETDEESEKDDKFGGVEEATTDEATIQDGSDETEEVSANDSTKDVDAEVTEEMTEDNTNGAAVEEKTEIEKKAETEVQAEDSVAEESQADTEERNENEDARDTQAIEPLEEINHNIFEFEYFKLGEVDVEDGAEIVFDTKYKLQYKWDTEDLPVKAGDTARLPLPDVFEHYPDNTPALPITTSDGNVVGQYTVTGGELVFVFNEGIEDADVQNGFVGFDVTFNNEKFIEEWEQDIDFDRSGEKDLTVVVKPAKVETGLDKEGHPDKDKDAREITWSIDFINGNEEAIMNGVLKDLIPEGVGEPRDFVVKELTFDFNGNKIVGNEVEFNELTVDGNGFELTFDNVPARGGYTVEYKTTITDYTISEFTNDATFTSDDVNLDAKTTVTTGERSNPIQKSGSYNWNTGQIDWTIVVNENGMEIENAIVYDELLDELSLVDGSIKVTKNWNAVEGLNPTEFPIELGEVKADEVYRINFSTTIDWSKVNGGEYTQNNQFTNETELTDGEDPRGKDDATVDVGRDSLLSKSGNASGYNYDDKVLSWTLDVNKAKHPISNAVITDNLPAGLDITEDDIIITNEAGEVVSADKIDITKNDDGTVVIINLGNIGTETLKITYKTEVEDFKANSFKNEATLDGDGIGENTPQDSETVTPPGNVYKKDFKGIDYSEKTIDWSITVDPRREAITELEIADTFPNNGMILLPDSVVVKIGGTELAPESYTLVPNTVGEETGYNKGFIITLNNISEDAPLNQVVTVDFKTSYDPQVEVDGITIDDHKGDSTLYKNHADFTGKTVNDHPIDEEDDAETNVREDSWNSGKKEGQLVHFDEEGNKVEGWESGSDRKIAWQIYTNYQKQNLGTGVSITDELDYEGTIDVDSIVVSVYQVSADGETTITEEALVKGTDYSVAVEGKKFTLTFADDFVVKDRYVIEFTTTVPDISQQNYKNNASVKVGDKNYPYSATVNYDKWNNYLDKQALGQEGTEVFIGEEIEWEVTVNEGLSIIKSATIKDTISAGLVYVLDSLEITTGSGSKLVESEDYTLEVTPSENGETVLDITFVNDVTEALTLNYKTVVTAENGQQVNNKVDLNGTGVENYSKESNKLTAKQFSWVGGNYNPKRGAIAVEKVDSDGNTIETGEATFELWYELNGERVQFGEAFATKNGVLEIGNLPLRTYYLKEVESPNGYILSDEEITIVVNKKFNNNPDNIFQVSFENIAEVEVPVEKIWEDADDQDGLRPASITVNLLADGEKVETATLTTTNNWSTTFAGLSPINENGEVIGYTVEEVAVEGYETAISGTAEDGFVITNTHEPELINVEGTKTWDDADNQDGKRPESITVRLLANGEEVESIEVTEEDEWTYAFTDLPRFENGVEITYIIQEDDVENYSAEIDGFDITNSYTPEQTSINVVKAWDDADNQDGKRPDSITVKLLANGVETDKEVVLSEENNWQADFTELDVNANGEAIEYTVEEIAVEGYETTVSGTAADGFVITNSYEPEQISVEGIKTWEDADNQDGIRPIEITVHLLANGEVVRSAEISEADEWKYAFTDLPKFANGEEIEYTVEEEEVLGYTSSIDGFNIINTHVPELVNVEGTKTWDDADNQDGKRPESITVYLLANGEPIDNVEVSADSEWTYAFTDLPKFENGEAIIYTVQEDVVEDYSTEIDGFDITNRYTPGKTSINVVKIWEDKDNLNGKRPESITVKLLADGEETGQVAELSDENNWQANFTDLDVNKASKAIEYTVEEVIVGEYRTEITGDAATGFVITNTQKTYAIGDYTWIDSNKDGIQDEDEEVLEGVKVELYDEKGNKIAETETDENGRYIFDELPAGNYQVKFTLTEEQAKKYKFTKQNAGDDSTVDSDADENGWTVVFTLDDDNAHLTKEYKDQDVKATEGIDPTWDAGVIEITPIDPATTIVSIEKIWKGDTEENRPEKITVDLLQNGKVFKTVELTEASDWAVTVDNLPAFDENGEAYEYTVVEHEVEGYESTITSEGDTFTITNTFIEEEPEDPKPEKPVDPKPEKPVDPKPEKPTPVDPKPENPNGNGEGTLPNTATNTFNYLLTGFVLLVLGGTTLFIRKRKSE